MSDEKKGILPPDNTHYTPYNPDYTAGPSAPPAGPIVPEEAPPAYSASPGQYGPPPQQMAPPPGGYNPYQQQSYAAAGYGPPPGAPAHPPMPPGVQSPPPMPPTGSMHAPTPYPGQQAPAPYPGQQAPAPYQGQQAPAHYQGQQAPAPYPGQQAAAPYSPVPQQPPPQAMVVQVTPQMRDHTVRSGFGRNYNITSSRMCCRGCWSRKFGFCCGGTLTVFAILIAVGTYFSMKSAFKATENFTEGTCKVYFHGIQNETIYGGTMKCDKMSCRGRGECKNKYDCYSVMGRVQFSQTNQSDLAQIYPFTAERNRYSGDCSYRPARSCKDETESEFRKRKAFDDEPFTCFYSTDPLIIVLEKNPPFTPLILIVPGIMLLVGIVMVVVVKFLGHMFSCPSDSQKLQQAQAQNKQSGEQMQPLAAQL